MSCKSILENILFLTFKSSLSAPDKDDNLLEKANLPFEL